MMDNNLEVLLIILLVLRWKAGSRMQLNICCTGAAAHHLISLAKGDGPVNSIVRHNTSYSIWIG